MGEVLVRSDRVRRRYLLLGIGAALFSGCNWKTFADDANQAPVRSIGAPDSFKSQGFGLSVLPLSDGQGKAAAFVASSVNDLNVVVVTIDAAGGASTGSIPGSALNDAEDSAISSLAEDTASVPLKLIMASPKVHNQGYGRVYSYPLSPTLEGNVTTLPVSTLPDEPGLGRGLAVGHLAGAEAKSDYVVASDNNIVVMVDGDAASWTSGVAAGSGCSAVVDPMLEARDRLHRPVLAARLWSDPAGPTVQQLVVGGPHPTGVAGSLSFYSVTPNGASFGLNCLTTVSAPKPEMRARFGVSLAVGDFNGDGNADLLVGAPPQNAYVYFGPFPTGAVPAPVAIQDADGVDFGYSVAALNVDGQLGDEALVGDPSAIVDGKDRAGRVTAFAWKAATNAMEVYKTYADHSPEANANFGATVNALKFCTASPSPAAGTACPAAQVSRVLLVGAANEMFVYYRVGANIPARVVGGSTVADVRAP